MGGNDIGIALHDDRFLTASDFIAGKIKSVKDGALVKNRALG